MRTFVSIVALAIIIGGCCYAYGRERIRKVDEWYEEDNQRFFSGRLPPVHVRLGNLQEQGWLGVTEVGEDGFLEIVIDRYVSTTESEVRAVERHEECHVENWAEEPAHGPAFQACKERLEKFVEVR